MLAAILARPGVPRVHATDVGQRAVTCARGNIDRLGLTGRVNVTSTDLFPTGRADLIVCNPPWLPGTPTSSLEAGVYDRDTRMLAGFLNQLPDHLNPGGQGWLILSDSLNNFQLRSSTTLPEMISRAGLGVHETGSTTRNRARPADHAPRPTTSRSSIPRSNGLNSPASTLASTGGPQSP